MELETHRLIEPASLSEEIIGKIGHQFVTRYGIKDEIATAQFTDDAGRLVAEMQLYHQALRQIRGVTGSEYYSLDECYQATMIKVLTFLIRMVSKQLSSQSGKARLFQQPFQRRCEQCSSNMQAKRIEIVRREVLSSFPSLTHRDLQYDVSSDNDGCDTILSDQQIIKKMVKLQRTLHQKQLGLMRCIDEFQDFRANLLVGRPKCNEKDLQDKFNAEEYVFNVGVYFSKNLKTIHQKISRLKLLCKQTQDIACQYYIPELNEQQCQAKVQAENIRTSNLKNQAEIRRLGEVCHKQDQSIKVHKMEVKHLREKVSELDLENHNLKQEIFIAELKNRQRQKEKEADKSKQEESRRNKLERKDSLVSIDFDIANEIISQLNEAKNQLESSGTKVEEIVPIIKSTFRKALEHFLHHSTNGQKKPHFAATLPSPLLALPQQKQGKRHRGSIKGNVALANYKKQVVSRFDVTPKSFRKASFQISNQISLSIAGERKQKRSSMDDHGVINGDLYRKNMLYKKTTTQTEGNLPFRKKTHVKLNSLSSQFKDPQNMEIDLQSGFNSPISRFNPYHHKTVNLEKSGFLNLQINTREMSQQLEGEDSAKSGSYKSRASGAKNEGVTMVLRQRPPATEKVGNLMQIKRLDERRTISPTIMRSFFDPDEIKQNQPNSGEGAKTQQQKDKDLHPQIKNIFSKLKNMGKTETDGISQYWDSPRSKPIRKQPLNLDEIAFMTSFFTLMAKSRLHNENLYLQLRKCIFESSKQTVSSEREEAILKTRLTLIVIKHRKCKGRPICGHLSQFLSAFYACLE